MQWSNFEKHVRELARHIWGSECRPEHLAGVDVDGVVRLKPNHVVLIEMTTNCTLNKIREDVTKLSTVRLSLMPKGVYTECFIVMSEEPTNSMTEHGDTNYVSVVSATQFSRLFFDFNRYQAHRSTLRFGSAANPYTGEPDRSDYIPVKYGFQSDDRDLDVHEIARRLLSGDNIILTGEYGTGKSRCFRELFKILSAEGKSPPPYPLAIDLRDHWGQKRGHEIIRRHFDDLGMSSSVDAVIRSLQHGGICLLLDGFDEIASQTWSENPERLRGIRHQSLEAVRDLISKTTGGVIIAGREHYFNRDEEMCAALGLNAKKTLLLRCYDEFDPEQMKAFLARITPDVELPIWLPRRPLISQIMTTIKVDHLEDLLSSEDGDVAFWSVFVEALCLREARIQSILDPGTLRMVMARIARYTRNKTANLGPVSPQEINRAFEAILKSPPTEDAAVVLQRLPGLGRIEAGTDARRFIDTYILDGLRADDVMACVRDNEESVANEQWVNPIAGLGQRILASDAAKRHAIEAYRKIARRCEERQNHVLAGDIIAALAHTTDGEIPFDYKDFRLTDSHITELELSGQTTQRLRIENSIIDRLIISAPLPEDVVLHRCVITRLEGVSSAKGLPPWITETSVDRFESISTNVDVKATRISVPHQILVTIVRKTFFQRGGARKEEALLRGLGQIDQQGATNKILNLLLQEKILVKGTGDQGRLYVPQRAHTRRMEKLLAELSLSQDPLWHAVSKLKG